MVLQLCKEIPGKRGEAVEKRNVKAWRWVGGLTPLSPTELAAPRGGRCDLQLGGWEGGGEF